VLSVIAVYEDDPNSALHNEAFLQTMLELGKLAESRGILRDSAATRCTDVVRRSECGNVVSRTGESSTCCMRSQGHWSVAKTT
jgi:hypothetical protein